jgi:shikimate dehydrogenase
LGQSVAGNPTQYLVEKAFFHHGMDWRYLSLEVTPEGLEDAVRGMRAMGFRGGNCIDPHKASIAPHLNRVTRSVELSGMVSCLTCESNGDWVGDNTEGRGFLASLRRRMDPVGKRAVIFGAEGPARVIAVELALAQVAEVVIVHRSESLARELCSFLTHQVGCAASFTICEANFSPPPDTHLIVDATPRTEAGSEMPLPVNFESVLPETVVADLSYAQPRTRLLTAAIEHQCPVIDGVEIFVDQIAMNFQLWTNVEPDRNVLREAAEEYLEW